MGLIYRNAFNDLDRSDSCFRAMLQITYIRPEEGNNRDIWDGIAEGNIGYNMLLRSAYDEAIPLLKSSMAKMLRFDDYAYASGPAINLADIYLKKDNTSEAKQYIDLSREYYDRMPREGRLSRIYEVMSRYYAATGRPEQSMAYMDSIVMALKKEEEQFNGLLLLRAEQRNHLREQQMIFVNHFGE